MRVFFHKGLLQLGCLDGRRELFMAAFAAFYFFLAYAEIWRLQSRPDPG